MDVSPIPRLPRVSFRDALRNFEHIGEKYEPLIEGRSPRIRLFEALHSVDMSPGDQRLAILYWTVRLFDWAAEPWNRKKIESIRGYERISVGALDVKEGGGFGIVVHSRRRLFRRISSFERRICRVGIEIDGHLFPMVIRREVTIDHASTLCHPDRGTATCAVQTQEYGRGTLVAKHVVSAGSTQSAQIVGTCNHRHRILAVAPVGIDAAVLEECHRCVPGRRLEVEPYVSQYSAVECHLRQRVVPNIVTTVCDTMGIFDAAELPALFYLRDHLSPGDSGALVTQDRSGRAIGLYRGGFRSQRLGSTGGVCNNIHQIENLLSISEFSR